MSDTTSRYGTGRHLMAWTEQPRCCQSMHVRDIDLSKTISAEKHRGLWRNADVREAVACAQEARRYPCVCKCHQEQRA